MANANLDFSGLSVTRTFTFPDATGTIALTTGSSSIVTVGTITTGVWHGTVIGVTYGGTGANLSATGGASQVVMQVSSGANFTVAQLASTDLSDVSTLTTNTQIGFDDPGISIPTTGNTISCGGPQLISLVAVRPTGTLAALTFNLVDGISNGIARILTTQIITAVTITGNVDLDATRSLLAAPTTLTPNQVLEYWWDESGSSPCWVRAV
jgi:hypothetical protein